MQKRKELLSMMAGKDKNFNQLPECIVNNCTLTALKTSIFCGPHENAGKTKSSKLGRPKKEK
jgi:hypothetical protein